MQHYTYRVEGRGRHDAPWFTTGTVTTERRGDFPTAVQDALRASFEALTEGVAVYGHPDTTCQGPYTILRLTVELTASTQ